MRARFVSALQRHEGQVGQAIQDGDTVRLAGLMAEEPILELGISHLLEEGPDGLTAYFGPKAVPTVKAALTQLATRWRSVR